jgi:hypothetical protein
MYNQNRVETNPNRFVNHQNPQKLLPNSISPKKQDIRGEDHFILRKM